MDTKTLCILLRETPRREVLLGLKKTRFGAGKFAGFGGGVEPGESIPQAALRELREETGLRGNEADLQSAARLDFLFPARPAWNQRVYVFVLRRWAGRPMESEEMRPFWFAWEDIPYDRMWPDAPYWLPRLLEGARLRGRFVYAEDNIRLREVSLLPWEA